METMITLRDAKLKPAERRRISELGEKLQRFFRSGLKVRWEFHEEGLSCVASLVVEARSGNYRARASGARYGEAMDAAFEKIIRQRTRVRSKRVASRRSADR